MGMVMYGHVGGVNHGGMVMILVGAVSTTVNERALRIISMAPASRWDKIPVLSY